MGIENNLFESANEYLNEEDDVFLVYIGKNTILPYSIKGKKINIKDIIIEKSISFFPVDNEKEITNKLKEINKKLLNEKNNDNVNLVILFGYF